MTLPSDTVSIRRMFLFCIGAGLLSVIQTGCAGGSARIIAPNVIAPVSCSDAVWGSDGKVYSVEKGDLLPVAEFQETYRRASVFFTLIPLGSRTIDLSEYLNEQLKMHNGDAIVHLDVETYPTAWSYLSGTFLISGAILPSYNISRIRGVVVRYISRSQ